MAKQIKEKVRGRGLLIFCLVLLFNPNIKIIDIMPDFIAYFFIMRMLRGISDAVPYFSELRSDIKKLFILNILRFPAQFIINLAKNQNTADTDAAVLMTLVFSVLELILLFSAITHLFNALFYMGERTEHKALISAFKLSEKRTMTPEALRIASYIFATVKCIFTLIPETFLLSFDTLLATTRVNYKLRAAYPYSIIAAVIIVAVFGAFWLAWSIKYLKAVSKENKFTAAKDSFLTPEKTEYIKQKRFLNKKIGALSCMTIGTFLTFDFVFSDFNYVNLLPHFIFPILLAIGFKAMTDGSKEFRAFKITSVIYTVSAFAAYISSVIFLSKYSYIDLSAISDKARNAYLPTIILAAFEFITMIFFMIFFAISMRKYIMNNTGISPQSEKYSFVDKEYHRALLKKSSLFAVIGILLGALRFVDVFLRSDTAYRFSDSNTLSVIPMTSVPWFGLIITLVAAVFAGFAFNYFGIIKDDVRGKHDFDEY